MAICLMTKVMYGFTYLALFSSSMMGLIISPNLLEIYVFWELVGMCSYLLVGFWYDRDGVAHAAQKHL